MNGMYNVPLWKAKEVVWQFVRKLCRMAWVLRFVCIDAQQAWPMQTAVWKALLSQRRLLIQTVSREKKRTKVTKRTPIHLLATPVWKTLNIRPMASLRNSRFSCSQTEADLALILVPKIQLELFQSDLATTISLTDHGFTYACVWVH